MQLSGRVSGRAATYTSTPTSRGVPTPTARGIETLRRTCCVRLVITKCRTLPPNGLNLSDARLGAFTPGSVFDAHLLRLACTSGRQSIQLDGDLSHRKRRPFSVPLHVGHNRLSAKSILHRLSSSKSQTAGGGAGF